MKGFQTFDFEFVLPGMSFRGVLREKFAFFSWTSSILFDKL